MAITNLQLNVQANTARALADFKKFSASLDNKFLISGLKLDVVRNALSQINREFQKSIGEQGLASASSLRAAQNQAALLTQTFKGFAADSATAINRDIGTALNSLAVRAGGTMKDVQKTLSATPFISPQIGTNLQKQLTEGMMRFQTSSRRAGLGDSSDIFRQFLSGTVTGRELVNSLDPLSAQIGGEIIKRSEGQDKIFSAKARSELVASIVGDTDIQDQQKSMAQQAMGYRITLEDLSTQLFNTESGVFGSLRKVIDQAGESTTIFEEVFELVEQVFGPNGMFRSLFSSITEVFDIGDPLRPFIDAIQFVTERFKDLTVFLQSEVFLGFLTQIKDVFDRVVVVFKRIFTAFSKVVDQISSGGFNPNEITDIIGQIGETIRGYIKSVGESIRGTQDDEKVAGFFGEVAGTIFAEIGKTAVVLIKELLMTLVDKVPTIAQAILPALNNGINEILTEAFGATGAGIVKFIAGFIPGPIGIAARASAVGDVTGGGGSTASMLAMGAASLLGPAALFGGAKFLRGASTQRGRFEMLNMLGDRAYNLETRLNKSFFLDDPLTGANRFSPISRRIIDPLSGRIRPSTQLASINPYYNPSSPNPLYHPSSPLPPRSIWNPRSNLPPSSILPGFSVGGPYSQLGKITPESSMFNPLFGGYSTPQEQFMRGEKLRRDRLIRGGMIKPHELIGGRFSALGRITPESSMFLPRASGGIPSPRGRGTTQYTGVIGPQPHGYDWAYDPSYGGVGGDYAPFIESSVIKRGAVGRMDPMMDVTGMSGYRQSLVQQRARNIRNIRMRRRVGRAGLLLGGAALAAGLVFGGGPGKAEEIDPATGMPRPGAGQAVGSVLSGGMEGAMMGATIGSIIPGVGTAAGAVIGGVIGGVAPLMDEGVRDGIGKFIASIGKTFTDAGTSFMDGMTRSFNWLKDGLSNTVKALANALIFSINGAIQAVTFLPRAISQLIENIPGIGMISGAKESLTGIREAMSTPIPYFTDGKGFAGPAMAMESRMSGRRPIIVNDGEFVIPSNGFATLAGLVSNNLRTTGVVNSGRDQPVQVNIALTVQSTSVVADASELAAALRDPVYRIIDDAWKEATQTNIQRARTA